MHYTNQCGPRWSVQNFREFLKSNKLDLRHPVGISTDLDDNPCLPCMAVKKIISLKNGRFPEIRRRSHYLFYPMPSGFDKVLPSFRGYYGVCSWEIQDFSTILFFMYFTNFYLLRYGFLVFNLLKRCTKGENLQTRIL